MSGTSTLFVSRMGELLISGFEQKESETWEAATRGFVYNVAKEEYVLRGINKPHSLQGDPSGGTLWNCESAENRLISRGGRVQDFPSTYLRGLAFGKNAIYAASNKRRLFSKSAGKVRLYTNNDYRGECSIYKVPYRGGKVSGEIRKVVDSSDSTPEIYDLLRL